MIVAVFLSYSYLIKGVNLVCFKRNSLGLRPLPLWHPQTRATILHALGTSERCAHIFSVLSPDNTKWFNRGYLMIPSHNTKLYEKHSASISAILFWKHL